IDPIGVPGRLLFGTPETCSERPFQADLQLTLCRFWSAGISLCGLMSTANPPHPTIGETIRTLRHRAGLSQEDLAEASGIHTTEISRLENGRRNPKWETMKRLAIGLKVPCWHLVVLAETLDLERAVAATAQS
ncbi:MAG TPA: helix-turn-helix transcriptional regulator, partial [Solirubrobacterales bacterium]